jgi:hypothetical protein
VSRLGHFAGPLGPQATNGVRTGWQGRFSGDALTGTVTTWAPCGGPGGGQFDAAFTAHPSGS